MTKHKPDSVETPESLAHEANRAKRKAWALGRLRWLLAVLVQTFGDEALSVLRQAVEDLADDGKLNGSQP